MEGDLIGAAAIAVAVALMPLAVTDASWVAVGVGVDRRIRDRAPAGAARRALTPGAAAGRAAGAPDARPRMILTPVPERAYTDAELDAAIAELTDPTRLRDAQDVVMRAAPSLQRVLAAAIAEGGWFDAAHEQAVREAAAEGDADDAAASGQDAARRGDPPGDARRRRGRL